MDVWWECGWTNQSINLFVFDHNLMCVISQANDDAADGAPPSLACAASVVASTFPPSAPDSLRVHSPLCENERTNERTNENICTNVCVRSCVCVCVRVCQARSTYIQYTPNPLHLLLLVLILSFHRLRLLSARFTPSTPALPLSPSLPL